MRSWLGHKGNSQHTVVRGVIDSFEKAKKRPDLWVEELEALEKSGQLQVNISVVQKRASAC